MVLAGGFGDGPSDSCGRQRGGLYVRALREEGNHEDPKDAKGTKKDGVLDGINGIYKDQI
jgi:hypothetical protein